MNRQVDKEKYSFDKYLPKERWISYWHQIDEVIKLEKQNILIIGKGDGIVPYVLNKIGMNVTTFDFDKDLQPDIEGSVEEISEKVKKNYDIILCCQVLEHTPFNLFDKIINDFNNITDRYLILSLPYESITFGIKIVIPKLRIPFILINISKLFKNWKYDGQHYWEVGVRGSTVRNIIKIIKKYFIIRNRYVVRENPYHMFFVLDKYNVSTKTG